MRVDNGDAVDPRGTGDGVSNEVCGKGDVDTRLTGESDGFGSGEFSLTVMSSEEGARGGDVGDNERDEREDEEGLDDCRSVGTRRWSEEGGLTSATSATEGVCECVLGCCRRKRMSGLSSGSYRSAVEDALVALVGYIAGKRPLPALPPSVGRWSKV
jgi:hypothetical protein